VNSAIVQIFVRKRFLILSVSTANLRLAVDAGGGKRAGVASCEMIWFAIYELADADDVRI
jgi:hypothetical protein